MKNRFYKILLSAVLAGVAVMPALADSTRITMSATAGDFLVIQIEKVSDNGVVSGDDFQKNSTDPAAYEILNFSNIDARGVATGTLSSGNGLLPGVPLQRVVLDSSRNVYNVTSPPAAVAGAIYFIKSGYQIRTIRSPGPSGELVTDVDVYNDGDIKTFVDLSSVNTLSAGSTVSAASIRSAGSGVGSKNLLKGSVANNTPFTFDLGIYVDNLTSVGAHTTTLTFTGT